MEEVIANGVTQQELAESAQYIIGVGLMIADDLLAHVGKERLSKVDTKAAYIVRITKPIPAWFFLYGIGINLLPPGGCTKIKGINKTFAEQWGLSCMMRELDPNNEYKLRAEHMLIDLKATEGRIVQIPKDDDIARLHIMCQQAHAAAPAKTARDPLFDTRRPGKRPPITEEVKIRRGLRALDRRRYMDAGLVPPPERLADLKKIQAAIDKKTHLDPTVDDSDKEEEDNDPRWRPENEEKNLLGKILHEMASKGPSKPPAKKKKRKEEEDESELGPPEEDLFGDPDGDAAPGSSAAMHAAVAEHTRKTTSRKPKRKSLQEVLRLMRARTRTQCPRRSDTYYLQDPPSMRDDMEQ